ncbi:hypothetical protein EC973_005401 [Apophysomyces ossiformis]|uniref:Uncharacterized protein n=1 Tax=Apophysomyces ossiformis TaxID=679940 RepID=A0A8H7BJA7_9FUNG|nr:hypothetical protein EC973_005401 [Apophysomyces ossiformis]
MHELAKTLDDTKKNVKTLETLKRQHTKLVKGATKLVAGLRSSYEEKQAICQKRIRDKRKAGKHENVTEKEAAFHQQKLSYEALKAAKLDWSNQQMALNQVHDRLANARRKKYKLEQLVKARQKKKGKSPAGRKGRKSKEEDEKMEEADGDEEDAKYKKEKEKKDDEHNDDDEEEEEEEEEKRIACADPKVGDAPAVKTAFTIDIRCWVSMTTMMISDVSPTDMLQLPKPIRITAKSLDETTFARTFRKKRERRKKSNAEVLAAEEQLKKTSMEKAMSVQDVIRCQELIVSLTWTAIDNVYIYRLVGAVERRSGTFTIRTGGTKKR